MLIENNSDGIDLSIQQKATRGAPKGQSHPKAKCPTPQTTSVRSNNSTQSIKLSSHILVKHPTHL